ncbi:sugar ABC transporter ATP-binding protein [Brevibacillus sp. B_LB10_24]|uniref:sugar ABC transporter ATP-binding protein n=1 Tax=Brevibacillus sp. B_LB10_24 TaxID=3380645 RepID=UPI0038BD787C
MASEQNNENVIEMRGVSKWFGGIRALHNVNLSVKKGSVHALMGENGAGKSTLMKILSGVYRKDEGNILLDGKVAEIPDYAGSQALGIALVPQELALVPRFSVAENIFLGREPRRYGSTLVDWKRLFAQTETLLKELNIKLNPRTPVDELSVSEQQMTVIAKALSMQARILIMDEPTARLGHQEAIQLLDYIRYLKSQQITVIYISHHLDEIFEISDEITVLRDGETILTKKTGDFDKDELIRLMVNRDIEQTIAKEQVQIGEELLRVENLSRSDVVKNVSFSVRRGEVLGISGLVGAGRSEMVRSLLGIDAKSSGRVFLEGREVFLRSVKDAVKAGLVLVPEERRRQGVVLDLSVRANISLGNLAAYSRGGLLQKGKERSMAADLVKKLNIKTSDMDQLVVNLSGGNQQKVVLAKWMNRPVKVFFLDEPTRGIDVGAKSEIYRLINQLASEGTAVVMISSEIPELQAICDRVLVMKEGQIAAELDRSELQAETILSHAIGS